MPTTYLEYHDDKSSKFWEITVNEKSFTVTYGRIGAKGQETQKSFLNAELAQKEAETLIRSKLKKGYQKAEVPLNLKEKAPEKEVKAEQSSYLNTFKKWKSQLKKAPFHMAGRFMETLEELYAENPENSEDLLLDREWEYDEGMVPFANTLIAAEVEHEKTNYVFETAKAFEAAKNNLFKGSVHIKDSVSISGPELYVLGDLIVDGVLELDEYTNLYIAGNLKAKGLNSFSVIRVGGKIEVEEVIYLQYNSYAHLFCLANSIKTKLFVGNGNSYEDYDKHYGKIEAPHHFQVKVDDVATILEPLEDLLVDEVFENSDTIFFNSSHQLFKLIKAGKNIWRGNQAEKDRVQIEEEPLDDSLLHYEEYEAYLAQKEGPRRFFWKINVLDKKTIVYSGRVGSQNSPKIKEYSTEEEAKNNAKKQIEAQRKKGYINFVHPDWVPKNREKKDKQFLLKIEEKLKNNPKSEYVAIEAKEEEYLKKWTLNKRKSLGNDLPKAPSLGLQFHMEYTPTKDEIMTVYKMFWDKFKWKGGAWAATYSSGSFSENIDPENPEEFFSQLVFKSDSFGVMRLRDKLNKGYLFNFYGMQIVNKGGVLEILFPIDQDPHSIKQLAMELAEYLPFSHGFCGHLTRIEDLDLGFDEHKKTLEIQYNWSNFYFGAEVIDTYHMFPAAREGFLFTSWLTFMNKGTRELLLKNDRSFHFKNPTIQVIDAPHFTLLQAGQLPSVGDLTQGFPHAYAEVRHFMSPLISMTSEEAFFLCGVGRGWNWLNRYEAPMDFITSPEDFIEELREELNGENRQEKISFYLNKLNLFYESYFYEALGKMAYLQLEEEKYKNIDLIYDFLSDFNVADSSTLLNLISCFNHNKKFEMSAKRLKQAEESAQENPFIYVNLISYYFLSGDVQGAIDILKKGEKFIDYPTYKIILLDKENDDELSSKVLFENKEFTALLDKIGQRVDAYPTVAARNKAMKAAIKKSQGYGYVESNYLAYAQHLKEKNDPDGEVILAEIKG